MGLVGLENDTATEKDDPIRMEPTGEFFSSRRVTRVIIGMEPLRRPEWVAREAVADSGRSSAVI